MSVRRDPGGPAEPAGAPPTRHVTSRRIVAVRGESLEVRDDRVIGEAPLEIRAVGPRQEPVAVAVTMRTPGSEAELAVGFLWTEGLLEGQEVHGAAAGDPARMNQPDDTVLVRLSRPFDDSKVAERHFIATASCGICGKASIDEVALRSDPIPEGPVVPRTVILALPDLLRAAQRAFDETGGLHAAALFTPRGELVAVREDVGRHNALDKLVGSQVLAGTMPLNDRNRRSLRRLQYPLRLRRLIPRRPRQLRLRLVRTPPRRRTSCTRRSATGAWRTAAMCWRPRSRWRARRRSRRPARRPVRRPMCSLQSVRRLRPPSRNCR